MNKQTNPGCEALETELLKIASVVATARRLLGEGKMVDLTSVEGKVQEVCESVQGMDPDQSAGLRPAMEGLLENLEALTGELEAQHDAFTAYAETQPDPAQAAEAYGQAGRKKRRKK